MQSSKSKCSPGSSFAISISLSWYIYSLIGLVWPTVRRVCVCCQFRCSMSSSAAPWRLLALCPASCLFHSFRSTRHQGLDGLACFVQSAHTHTAIYGNVCGCCLAASFRFLRLCGCLVTLQRCVARCDTAANCESQLVSADCSPNSYINFRIFFVHCLCAVKCAVFH